MVSFVVTHHANVSVLDARWIKDIFRLYLVQYLFYFYGTVLA